MDNNLTLEEIASLVKNMEAEQEWRGRQRKRHMRQGFLGFLVFMLLLTFVCRINYTNQLPQVEWSYMNSGTLSETISLDGVISTNSPGVVYGLEKLRISTMDAFAGEQVKRGDLLYKVDTEDLQSLLDELTAEHGTWWKRAQNWYEDARTETAWHEADVREALIARWQELLDNGGRVRAEESGMILEVLAEVGDRMDGTPVMQYVNENSPLMFQAVVDEKQKSRIHIGDNVTIKFSGSKKETQGKIDWLEEENGGSRVTVWLNSGEGQGEMEGSLKLDYVSQAYDYIIPIEALHKDTERCCIYVLKEKEGILGTELSAEKLDVRLLEESSTQAAIAEELLESGMKIITDSDRELNNGAAVREKAE